MISGIRRALGLEHRNPRRIVPAPEIDIGWLDPPQECGAPDDWDRYWSIQVSHGLGPQLFDLFCDDRALVGAMRASGMTSILCAGNGISQEPRALAAAGFDVTAIDSSPVATRLAEMHVFDPRGLEHFIDGSSARPGGAARFVVGDFLDEACAPGPFDAVVERRTVQGLPPDMRDRALEALTARLSADGIFWSQCHDASARPGQTGHAAESWLRARGWTIGTPSPSPKAPGRIAWLSMTKG